MLLYPNENILIAYCDVYLTHDAPRVRKDHNAGWKHAAQVRAHFLSQNQDRMTRMVGEIVKDYEERALPVFIPPPVTIGRPPVGMGMGPGGMMRPPPPPQSMMPPPPAGHFMPFSRPPSKRRRDKAKQSEISIIFIFIFITSWFTLILDMPPSMHHMPPQNPGNPHFFPPPPFPPGFRPHFPPGQMPPMPFPPPGQMPFPPPGQMPFPPHGASGMPFPPPFPPGQFPPFNPQNMPPPNMMLRPPFPPQNDQNRKN